MKLRVFKPGHVSEVVRSYCLPVRNGVAQGSVLAPVLFSLYTNDIASFLSDASFTIYADDISLLVSHTCIR